MVFPLSDVHLSGCPSLKTPPNEVVGRGLDAIKAYLKRLSGGTTENWRTKTHARWARGRWQNQVSEDPVKIIDFHILFTHYIRLVRKYFSDVLVRKFNIR